MLFLSLCRGGKERERGTEARKQNESVSAHFFFLVLDVVSAIFFLVSFFFLASSSNKKHLFSPSTSSFFSFHRVSSAMNARCMAASQGAGTRKRARERRGEMLLFPVDGWLASATSSLSSSSFFFVAPASPLYTFFFSCAIDDEQDVMLAHAFILIDEKFTRKTLTKERINTKNKKRLTIPSSPDNKNKTSKKPSLGATSAPSPRPSVTAKATAAPAARSPAATGQVNLSEKRSR